MSHTKSSFLRMFGQPSANLQEPLSAAIKVVDERLTVGLPTGYAPGTAVCGIVNRLTSKTPVAELPTIREIIALGTRTDELGQGLEALQQTIGIDPKLLAYRYRRVQGVVSSFVEELTKALDTLSQAKAPGLEQAVSHARATAEAASLAATTLFKDEPLPHVGSDPWQLMCHHAKDDSSKLAYPELEPPTTREGNLCVLCQQPLPEEAAERLGLFDNFVFGKVREDAEKGCGNAG